MLEHLDETRLCFQASSISSVAAAPGEGASHQQPQVRVLTLNHKDHLDSTLFRLQKGTSVITSRMYTSSLSCSSLFTVTSCSRVCRCRQFFFLTILFHQYSCNPVVTLLASSRRMDPSAASRPHASGATRERLHEPSGEARRGLHPHQVPPPPLEE